MLLSADKGPNTHINDKMNQNNNNNNTTHKNNSKKTKQQQKETGREEDRPMQKDTVMIVNPNSKSGLTGKNWDTLFSTLSKAFGDKIDVVFTKKSGDGTLLAREFLRKGFKNIIPIGGDGMINEVANGFFEEVVIGHGDTNYNFNDGDNDKKSDKNKRKLFGKKGFKSKTNVKGNNGSDSSSSSRLSSYPKLRPINPDAVITILPCGTRNVLVRSLGLPSDLEECCKVLAKSKATKKIDVISAIVRDTENPSNLIQRVFLNAAEMGMGAEVIDKAKETRKKVKSRLLSTLIGLFSTVSTFEGSVCNVSIDDGQEKGKGNDKESHNHRNLITKMTMGVIANGKYLGGGFNAAPQANISDGLLDVVIIKDSDGFKMIDKLIGMKMGDHSNQNDKVYYEQAKNVFIRPNKAKKNITVTVDGEPIGDLPAVFRVYPNLLTMRT